MAIEVPVRKEISTFESRPAFGLTVRQLVSFGVALPLGAVAYVLFMLLLSHKAASSITMLIVAPIFAIGLVKIKGYPLEKYIAIVWAHRFTEQRTLYKTENAVVLYLSEEEYRDDLSKKFLSRAGREAKPGEEPTVSRMWDKKLGGKAVQLAKKECAAEAVSHKKRLKARQKADAGRKGGTDNGTVH